MVSSIREESWATAQAHGKPEQQVARADLHCAEIKRSVSRWVSSLNWLATQLHAPMARAREINSWLRQEGTSSNTGLCGHPPNTPNHQPLALAPHHRSAGPVCCRAGQVWEEAAGQGWVEVT